MVNLSHNNSVDLPESLADKKVVFTSSTLDLARPASKDNTSLNLRNHNGDTVLHISFRRHADVIILGTRKAGDGHPLENALSLPRLERAFGPSASSATITVKDVDTTFQVFVNGNYLATFLKRFQGEAKTAAYIIDPGQDSIFSNPVTVEIQA